LIARAWYQSLEIATIYEKLILTKKDPDLVNWGWQLFNNNPGFGSYESLKLIWYSIIVSHPTGRHGDKKY
jgi:hypothetical protein